MKIRSCHLHHCLKTFCGSHFITHMVQHHQLGYGTLHIELPPISLAVFFTHVPYEPFFIVSDMPKSSIFSWPFRCTGPFDWNAFYFTLHLGNINMCFSFQLESNPSWYWSQFLIIKLLYIYMLILCHHQPSPLYFNFHEDNTMSFFFFFTRTKQNA